MVDIPASGCLGNHLITPLIEVSHVRSCRNCSRVVCYIGHDTTISYQEIFANQFMELSFGHGPVSRRVLQGPSSRFLHIQSVRQVNTTWWVIMCLQNLNKKNHLHSLVSLSDSIAFPKREAFQSPSPAVILLVITLSPWMSPALCGLWSSHPCWLLESNKTLVKIFFIVCYLFFSKCPEGVCTGEHDKTVSLTYWVFETVDV